MDRVISNTIYISADSLGNAPYQYQYLIAGFEVYCQTEVALIGLFEKVFTKPFELAENFEVTGFRVEDSDIKKMPKIFDDKGAFSGGFKQVGVRYQNTMQWMEIDGEDFSLTDIENGYIRLLGNFTADEQAVAEIVLGPPLLCILAAAEILSFHAGAVSTANGTAMFIGESGRGKSTLSQTDEAQQWQRLGDDIMPTVFGYESQDNVCGVLTRFPQLKRTQQTLIEGALPLKVIFRIAPPIDSEKPVFKPVSGAQAILTLSRHIASSKVFSPKLLTTKMQFVSKIAGEVPLIDLSYCRDLEKLSELKGFIDDQIGRI